MTIQELYEKLRPSKTHSALAQMLSDGLSVNISDFFTRLIRDAARCNSYSSDVYYDLCAIDKAIKEYRIGREFTPIFVGFRRHGVDGNSFILSRIEGDPYAVHREYFALYSVMVVPDTDPEGKEIFGWYKVLFNEYWL